jgi:hypothetical protein
MTKKKLNTQRTARLAERGNVLFVILLAIVLIGALTIAIQGSNDADSANIDDESLAIKTTEVQRFASEVERGVNYILQNGISENDLRVSHPKNHSDYGDLSADGTPEDQVFHKDGGAANYRTVPSDINDGSAWEFYGSTSAPNVGSARADMLIVLPNVTQQFCEWVNKLNGQTGDQPEDTGSTAPSANNAGACVSPGAVARFRDAKQFYSTANTMDTTTFSKLPAKQACVECTDMTGSPYMFYHVVLAR